MPNRRYLLQCALIVPASLVAPSLARAEASVADAPSDATPSEATWNGLKPMFFGDKPIDEKNGYIVMEAPVRAEDAAIVPIQLKFPKREAGDRVVTATLIVDENPAPMVTTLKRGQKQGLGGDGREFDFSLRIRVNSYSYVRVVAETESGALHMVKAFVKAAGGCSAPAGKDPEEAKNNVGKMRFRSFAGQGMAEAQAMIRHPNYSGMQMDQITRMYTPAWYITEVRMRQGDDLVFSMENGISLSEDPTLRFSYVADGRPVRIEAKDSQGASYGQTFSAEGAAY